MEVEGGDAVAEEGQVVLKVAGQYSLGVPTVFWAQNHLMYIQYASTHVDNLILYATFACEKVQLIACHSLCDELNNICAL